MSHEFALVLGGGGARGVAHIGAIRALEEAGLRPSLVTGTSMGAMVGAIYAQHPGGDVGWTRLQEFLESDLFKRTKVQFIQPATEEFGLAQRARHFVQRVYLQGRVLTRPSVIAEDVVRSVVDYFIEDGYLEDTRIPFAAVAADMGTGQAVTLHQGPIREAVQASMSIPGFMPPVELNGRLLMDGGMVALVPIEAAISLGATRVVAVDVERELSPLQDGLSALELIFRADEIQGNELRNLKNRAADLVLVPQVGETHWSDFKQVEQVMNAGRAAVERNLDAIRRVLAAPTRPAPPPPPPPEKPRPGPWAGLRRLFTRRGRGSDKQCRADQRPSAHQGGR